MSENQSSPSAPIQGSGAPVTFAHQAILDAKRAIVGYELFDRSVLSSKHTAASDAQLLFNVLSGADGESPIGKKDLFINCTHDSLSGGHLDLVAPQRVVLEIPPLGVSDVDQILTRLPNLQEIRRRGFRLAFDYSVLTQPYAPWLELASFIKFDLSIMRSQSVAS
jgi:EAL and modified HD-GYP domain-containing signal transduction protein